MEGGLSLIEESRNCHQLKSPLHVTPKNANEDSGETELCFRREAERHSGMNPNALGA